VPMLAFERRRRHRIALRLAVVSIAWNVVEAVVTIAAGVITSPIALVGFGLGSSVEVVSASVMVWQMTRPIPEEREAQALRLIAVSFLGLAYYVSVEAIIDLLQGHDPKPACRALPWPSRRCRRGCTRRHDGRTDAKLVSRRRSRRSLDAEPVDAAMMTVDLLPDHRCERVAVMRRGPPQWVSTARWTAWPSGIRRLSTDRAGTQGSSRPMWLRLTPVRDCA
jgi:hypothetical protein